MGNTSYILLQITKLCYNYASPCRMILGPKVAVLIHDPEQIKTVFLSSKTTEKHEFYDFSKPWTGNGLITAPRSIWRVHRKLIQPAFSTKILQSFVTIFQKTSILLAEEFSRKVGRPEFDVYPDVSFTSFRNICDQNQKKPFLDLMLEMADKGIFTDDEVREHADTLIEAGYDTVSRTNCFTLLMLASHPDIQDKVYKELYKIYGPESPDETPVKLEDLKHMDYLERVIKEVMRLYPVVPLLGRKLLEDFPLDGYLLPKDCGIITSVIALHRDKKYWTDPLKFNPDRFLPEEVEKQIPYTYMPFSLGPRDCIGRVYAMMSMKILMATLLRKYVLIKDQIKPIEDIQIKFAVVLEPAEPITMRIEKRVK
ncbi:cytochrome P450 4C1-like [Belonocnema kinseyi]|uniref:cytochrome P450 4C1-like n=1 Tax=Belonocnema kinseyi TaxID=2817044 RepID=UPI00143D077D|nr:cytochrome P450 4C1-like [Belonocnema kinseyi]